MRPILFSIGPVHFYSFGLMAALGAVMALYWMEFRADREGFLQRKDIFPLLFVIVISGFFGSRLLYVIQNYKLYLQSPLSIFALWEGGLIVYGGIVMAVLGLWGFARIKKVSFVKLLDFVAPFFSLAHGISRIGCFLNGCCQGAPSTLPWAVRFPGAATSVHPAQLYEAAYNIGLFIFLNMKYKRKHYDGEIALLYCMGYPLGRFIIEFFRAGNPTWLMFTYNQWQSIFIFLVAGFIYLLRRHQYRSSRNLAG